LVIAGMFLLLPLGGNAQSVWKDKATGLTWATQDNGSRIDWQSADGYCKNLKNGSYSWRLPTIDELEKIYDPTQNGSCGKSFPGSVCHIKGGIQLSGPAAWSSNQGSHPKWAWIYFFNEGKRSEIPWLNYTFYRALCVAN